MRRTFLLVLGSAVLALVVSACGGRYEETGFDITFAIPSGFHVAHDVTIAKSSGASAKDQAAVALDQDNLIILQRYDLRATVTAENLSRFKGEVDRVIGQLAGKRVSGNEVEHGGLPGYQYVISIDRPAQGQSRLAVLFDQAVEYLVNCQSTPAKRGRVEQGCRTVLDSIEHV